MAPVIFLILFLLLSQKQHSLHEHQSYYFMDMQSFWCFWVSVSCFTIYPFHPENCLSSRPSSSYLPLSQNQTLLCATKSTLFIVHIMPNLKLLNCNYFPQGKDHSQIKTNQIWCVLHRIWYIARNHYTSLNEYMIPKRVLELTGLFTCLTCFHHISIICKHKVVWLQEAMLLSTGTY